MRKLLYGCLAVAVLAVLATGVTGQVAGQHLGVFFGTSIYTTTTSALGLLDGSNKFQAYPTSTTGPWTHWGNMWHGAQDVDNQSVITYALVGAGPSRYAFVMWDPILPGVVNTLWSAPWVGRFPANVTKLDIDSNGDIVGFDSQVNQAVRYDRTSGKWSGSTLSVNLGINTGLGGFIWDKINGGFYVANARDPSTIQTTQTLASVSADLKTTKLLARTNNSAIRANMGGDLLDNGDWVASSWTANRYHTVPAGTSNWVAGPAVGGITTTSVSAEKFAAPKRGYYASQVATVTSQTIAYVDATTNPHTVVNLAPLQALPGGVQGWIMTVLSLYNREIATLRTGKATWDILVNPDPTGKRGLAGKTFIVAASLTGGRPPIPLPGGREVFLVPDTLTVLTVQGAFAPFITGNVGKLNVFGKATAKMNLGLLKTGANGTVLHLCGLVLDPAAPTGVAWVFDPWAFVVDVQP